MSMGMAMAEECSTHRYLMSPSHPLQGICPYCLTQRICFLKIQQKQVSSFSFYKKRRSNNSNSFFLSLFSKLHCGRCLPPRKSISSGHPTHGTNFSATFPSKPNFPAKIPCFASIERFQEWPIIWRGSKSTPLNGIDLNNSDSDDDDGPDYEWTPSPDAVLGVKRREVPRIANHFERKQQPATWKEMHPTALGPLAPTKVMASKRTVIIPLTEICSLAANRRRFRAQG
ncbi:hypothetical protein AMTRI_Chr12g272040 [Amborella trichopoda]